MPFAPGTSVVLPRTPETTPAKKRKLDSNPATVDGKSARRNRDRLHRASPGAIERARQRRDYALLHRQQVYSEAIDPENEQLTYPSTQETIKVTPDALGRSLRRSKRNIQAAENIFATSTPKSVVTATKPKAKTKAKAKDKGKTPVTTASPQAESQGEESRVVDRPTSPIQEVNDFVPSSIEVPLPDLNELLKKPALTVPSSPPRLEDDGVSEEVPFAAAQPVATTLSSTTIATPVQSEALAHEASNLASSTVGDAENPSPPSVGNRPDEQDDGILRSNLQAWLDEGDLDADQIADILHGSSDNFEPPPAFVRRDDREAYRDLVPRPKFRLALRDLMRKLAEKFMSLELMNKAEFLPWLRTARREDKELFWSAIREHKKFSHLTKAELKPILNDIYPTVWPPETTSTVPGYLRTSSQVHSDTPEHDRAVEAAPQLETQETLQSPINVATSMSRAQEKDSDVLTNGAHVKAVQDDSADFSVVITKSSSVADADGTGDRTVEEETSDESSEVSKCFSVDGNESNTLLSSRWASDESVSAIMSESDDNVSAIMTDSEDGTILAKEIFERRKKSSTRQLRSDHEIAWRAHAATNPIYTKGMLSEDEKLAITLATTKLMADRQLSTEDFCEFVHKGKRKAAKTFWSSLVYCIKDRKPKSIREYIKKAYPIHKRSVFSQKEKADLVRLVKEHGRAWSKIGKIMGRWREDCQHTYLRLESAKNENLHEGSWSQKEQSSFDSILAKFGTRSIHWNVVAETIGTRTPKQCHDHYRVAFRTDESYVSGAHAASTPSRPPRTSSFSARKASRTPKATVASPPPLTHADVVELVDYLIALPLESIDNFDLPNEIGKFETFGYEQLKGKITSQRKRLKSWRELSTLETLMQIRDDLLLNIPRIKPSQEL